MCILDFVGNIRTRPGYHLSQASYSADFAKDRVVFSGLLYDVPDFMTNTLPTEDDVWEHIMAYIHSLGLTLQEFYEKAYLESDDE